MSKALKITTDIFAQSNLKLKQFVMCDQCYWCASTLDTRGAELEVCPQCKYALSALPIGIDEAYSYNYDVKRGVELQFSTRRL